MIAHLFQPAHLGQCALGTPPEQPPSPTELRDTLRGLDISDGVRRRALDAIDQCVRVGDRWPPSHARCQSDVGLLVYSLERLVAGASLEGYRVRSVVNILGVSDAVKQEILDEVEECDRLTGELKAILGEGPVPADREEFVLGEFLLKFKGNPDPQEAFEGVAADLADFDLVFGETLWEDGPVRIQVQSPGPALAPAESRELTLRAVGAAEAHPMVEYAHPNYIAYLDQPSESLVGATNSIYMEAVNAVNACYRESSERVLRALRAEDTDESAKTDLEKALPVAIPAVVGAGVLALLLA